MVRHELKSYGSEDSQIVEKIDTVSGLVKNSKGQVNHNQRSLLSDDEAGPSSNQEYLSWVDDYKCSLCGVELPNSFVEERQEHSDFHFAERLQEEESGNYNGNLTMKQRYHIHL